MKVEQAMALPQRSVEAPAQAPAAKSLATRYGFVDLLRGWALVVMIETHIVNAYLRPDLRHEPFFFWLTFVNGLVAPSFLFASGFSAFLQASRNWQDCLRLGPAFWVRMRRLGFILLVAYYTHLRGFKFSKYLENEPGIWKETLQVDILQCIVASLLALHVLILLSRTPARFALGAGLAGAAVMLATPWVWARDVAGTIPEALALWVSPHGVSYFPLFPWFVFVAAGAAGAYLFKRSAEDRRELDWMRRAAGLGVVLIVVGLLGRLSPLSLPGYRGFYTTSPLYALIRLGCVLLLLAALYLLERFAHFAPPRIRAAGQESLLVYGLHLWLIFAVLRGKHVGPILGLEAGYLGCFLASIAVIAAMVELARRWHLLKQKHPTGVRRGQAIVVAGMIVVFLLR
jgi:uncharacterized membrane protein